MKYSYTFNPFKRGDHIRTVPFLSHGETEFIVLGIYKSGISVKPKVDNFNFFVFWNEVLGFSKKDSFNDDEWE